MPLKLTVGLSKKVGLPEFSSVGATCSLDCELDATLLDDDREGFRRRVAAIYDACRQSIDDELARHNGKQVLPESHADTNPVADPVADRVSATPPTQSNGNGNGNGNGNSSDGRPATDKQIDYVHQLSDQVRGLGIRRLESLAQKLFDKPVAGLQSFEASVLIDTLKQIKAGSIDLQDALSGVTT